MTPLLARAIDVGVPCNGLIRGRHYGWTTDAGKAEALKEAGARVEIVYSGNVGPVSALDEWTRIIGYEISFPVEND